MKFNKWLVAFVLQILAIGAITSLDIYFAVKLADIMHEIEWNPIGRWLIYLDNNSVALFMAIKAAVAGITTFSTTLAYHYRPKTMVCVLIPLTLSQIVLLYILLFAGVGH